MLLRTYLSIGGFFVKSNRFRWKHYEGYFLCMYWYL